MSVLRVFGELGVRVEVDPAMPEGVMEVRTSAERQVLVIAPPVSPQQQAERDAALIARARAAVRAGRNAAWSNEAQASLDRLNDQRKDGRP